MKQALTGFMMLASLIMAAPSALAADWDNGNAENGQKVFRKCQACHKVDKDGSNAIGPNLYKVIGRKAATEPGYSYSAAMKAKGAEGLIWTKEQLFSYLETPQAHIPGTAMTFAGLKKPQDRRDVIAYLESVAK